MTDWTVEEFESRMHAVNSAILTVLFVSKNSLSKSEILQKCYELEIDFVLPYDKWFDFESDVDVCFDGLGESLSDIDPYDLFPLDDKLYLVPSIKSFDHLQSMMHEEVWNRAFATLNKKVVKGLSTQEYSDCENFIHELQSKENSEEIDKMLMDSVSDSNPKIQLMAIIRILDGQDPDKVEKIKSVELSPIVTRIFNYYLI